MGKVPHYGGRGIKAAKRDNTELVRALSLGETSNYTAWRTQQ